MTDALVEERLVSRIPGVPLNPEGRAQIKILAEALSCETIDAMYSGPLERARETAAILGGVIGLSADVIDGLDEIEFGEWSGKTLGEMHGDEEWMRFHRLRSCLKPPGGESFLDVQARFVPMIAELRCMHDDQSVALVTHADVVKAGLAHYGGISLDLISRYEISPASVTTMTIGEDWVKIEGVNVTFD